MQQLVERLRRLLDRPDFRAHPLRALFRRLQWRRRWLLHRGPWRLVTPLGYPLWIPKSGSGALIYYQGFSEPETARFLQRVLAPGMIFLDVGAHFGEYTVMAARLTAGAGAVHAFEPQPGMFALLETNVSENHVVNVTLNRCAVADREGEAVFWERTEPASSSLAADGPPDGGVVRAYTVPVCTLDGYCARHAITPHVIKVDVEGAECAVLLGARGLCSLPPAGAPIWLLEYSPSAGIRFGERTERLLEILLACEYRWFTLAPDGELSEAAPRLPEAATVNLVASKRRPF